MLSLALGQGIESKRRQLSAAEGVLAKQVDRRHTGQIKARDAGFATALELMSQKAKHRLFAEGRADIGQELGLAGDDADIERVALVAGPCPSNVDQIDLYHLFIIGR